MNALKSVARTQRVNLKHVLNRVYMGLAGQGLINNYPWWTWCTHQRDIRMSDIENAMFPADWLIIQNQDVTVFSSNSVFTTNQKMMTVIWKNTKSTAYSRPTRRWWLSSEKNKINSVFTGNQKMMTDIWRIATIVVSKTDIYYRVVYFDSGRLEKWDEGTTL